MITLRRYRRSIRAALVLAVSATLGLTMTGAASASPAVWTQPVLTAVRAAHHPGYDRVVFEFTGSGPAKVRAGYVSTLIADGSGLPVPIAGRAILQVTMTGADAHTSSGQVPVPDRAAYALPNVITTVRSGDFEAVVSYGIGLAQRTAFTVSRLSNPSRVVVDVRTNFRTVTERVYFTDAKKIAANASSVVTAVYRQVPASAPAAGVLDRLYAGPTAAEKARGLSFTASQSTGFTRLSIVDRVARVRLLGGCSSGGSAVVTVASDIMPTLKQFASVRWVKIYDPAGHTERPYGHSDSIPECLEP